MKNECVGWRARPSSIYSNQRLTSVFINHSFVHLSQPSYLTIFEVLLLFSLSFQPNMYNFTVYLLRRYSSGRLGSKEFFSKLKLILLCCIQRSAELVNGNTVLPQKTKHMSQNIYKKLLISSFYTYIAFLLLFTVWYLKHKIQNTVDFFALYCSAFMQAYEITFVLYIKFFFLINLLAQGRPYIFFIFFANKIQYFYQIHPLCPVYHLDMGVTHK
jgi:hypothetical protein